MVGPRAQESCGVLNINKSAGMTSHDVVDVVRRLYRIRKVGHTGTLDPRGTGVLPICVGRATKIAQFLTTADKEYEMVVHLGVTTDTQDADGKVIAEAEVRVTLEEVDAALRRFEGEIQQIPPLFSAKKVRGERLYRMARRGEEVPREPVTVQVYAIRLSFFNPPFVGFWVHCSKGTYARTLCDDLGKMLGCGAHLHHLVRVRAGRFELKDALTLGELKAVVAAGRGEEALIPVEEALGHLPAVRVLPEAARLILHGSAVTAGQVVSVPPEVVKGMLVRVLGFRRQLLSLATATLDAGEFTRVEPRRVVLKPVRVFGALQSL
ncbi:MAG: tRNA pseudouridine(55) synthase TruB [Candidatus Methylomirabilales bacterium]